MLQRRPKRIVPPCSRNPPRTLDDDSRLEEKLRADQTEAACPKHASFRDSHEYSGACAHGHATAKVRMLHLDTYPIFSWREGSRHWNRQAFERVGMCSGACARERSTSRRWAKKPCRFDAPQCALVGACLAFRSVAMGVTRCEIGHSRARPVASRSFGGTQRTLHWRRSGAQRQRVGRSFCGATNHHWDDACQAVCTAHAPSIAEREVAHDKEEWPALEAACVARMLHGQVVPQPPRGRWTSGETRAIAPTSL